MVNHDTFYKRLEICKPCAYWRGVCLKGHSLRGAAGCPIRKFEPVDAADYAHDKPVDLTKPAAAPCHGCSQAPPEIKPMTWAEALEHLGKSMKTWRSQGFPLCEGPVYGNRIAICKNCPEYAWWQCRVCRCVVVTKAKLKTETCPKGKWC
jgi:hypothetical protein